MPARTQPSESTSQLWNIVIVASFLAGFAALVASLSIPLLPRLAEYRELAAHGQVLEAERAGLQHDIARREAELQMLERDPLFVEIKARDTLDLCQPGEVVFRFEDSLAE